MYNKPNATKEQAYCALYTQLNYSYAFNQYTETHIYTH